MTVKCRHTKIRYLGFLSIEWCERCGAHRKCYSGITDSAWWEPGMTIDEWRKRNKSWRKRMETIRRKKGGEYETR